MTESTKTARELNAELLYTMYSVFLASPWPAGVDREQAARQVEELFETGLAKDVYTRGTYAVGGYRADADLMVWWTCPDPDGLQDMYARLRATELGTLLVPVWSAVGLHRPAEFNKNHIPAYVRRETPRRYVCVYPFVRPPEWYLLPEAERRAMLAEHGQMGREYEDVRANTVAAFGLGDYEWLLAFEADDLHRIVDLVRHLRYSQARKHVALETPFFTGARRPIREIVGDLA